MATRQKPTTIINEIIPKRISEQFAALPDQLFLDYSRMVDALKPPYAIDNADSQHAGVLLTGAQLFALNQDLSVSVDGVESLSVFGAIGVLQTATNGLLAVIKEGAASILARPNIGVAGPFDDVIGLGIRVLSKRGLFIILIADASQPGRLFLNVSRRFGSGVLLRIGLHSLGPFTGGLLNVVSLGLDIAFGLIQIANKPTEDGAFINIWADGHGYPVQTIKIQRKTATTVSGLKSAAWQEQRRDGFLNFGSAYLQESESNAVGTIKRYQQFVPLREPNNPNQFMQFRAAAITSQNETDDDATLSWAESVILRESDFGRLWIRIQANDTNTGLELIRADSSVPTYPTDSGEGGGG